MKLLEIKVGLTPHRLDALMKLIRKVLGEPELEITSKKNGSTPFQIVLELDPKRQVLKDEDMQLTLELLRLKIQKEFPEANMMLDARRPRSVMASMTDEEHFTWFTGRHRK